MLKSFGKGTTPISFIAPNQMFTEAAIVNMVHESQLWNLIACVLCERLIQNLQNLFLMRCADSLSYTNIKRGMNIQMTYGWLED